MTYEAGGYFHESTNGRPALCREPQQVDECSSGGMSLNNPCSVRAVWGAAHAHTADPNTLLTPAREQGRPNINLSELMLAPQWTNEIKFYYVRKRKCFDMRHYTAKKEKLNFQTIRNKERKEWGLKWFSFPSFDTFFFTELFFAYLT